MADGGARWQPWLENYSYSLNQWSSNLSLRQIPHCWLLENSTEKPWSKITYIEPSGRAHFKSHLLSSLAPAPTLQALGPTRAWDHFPVVGLYRSQNNMFLAFFFFLFIILEYF